ncbi:permease-like cell division protein FtsX [Tenacibaculum maritimum]|uniref:cell division protein FtsX n=1 Tax=Tenacibaculum maritimum TaxID=107401 RepID=UPI0004234803|nr:permease-like cell division protein FtsX [Tenacibaculum maritimum]MCD9580871.1 permease-like cell division protein FtsX [Tenacibaculum maritimum]MCD9584016.1 permease-like cell division protein FtsX [Tenacibaculum maritimum]MCD9610350.1 permease-like cell division protein FtsX [Tenacibaculum maritimum]MCD9620032.1 permease-like cell division protein FtsX [Tenacibaculum maritimum]MCD9626386.1 permease-like cell division protein FtsX [Tenacibaculum maritimum]
MSTSFDSFQKRRLQSSYISVTISIALVLFMIGVLGLILLKSTKVANHFKEKVAISIFLKDHVDSKQAEALKSSLLKEAFAKKVYYITKEEAANSYKKDLGEDFLKFLGDNPLKNGIDIYLKAAYVTPEKMANIEKELAKNNFVYEVNYDKPLVQLLTKNIQKISFWLLVLSGFFGIVAIILINSSIRLSIYAKRFNIKTMQMVGATKSFIRKPFIWQSIKLGFLGAILALIGLGFLIYYVDQYIPTLELLSDYISISYVAGGILIAAFIITSLSTFFATQRFLNLQTNDLYY